MSKYIFKPENIGVNKPEIFDVLRKSIFVVGHIHFKENIVSRIAVEKIAEYPDTIFINLYSGNLQTYYNLKPATKFDNEG